MALDPHKSITQYSVQVWNIEGGLPGNSVLAVRQTQDGYLWIGTQDGLVRFDGLNFEVYDTINTPSLKDNVIRALYADRGGGLWIGTSSGGLTCRREGEFTNYPIDKHPSLYKISAIDGDRWGNLWIGSITRGLTCFNPAARTFTTYTTQQGLPHNQVRFITKDGKGDLWMTTVAGIVKLLHPGKFQIYAPQDRLPYFKTACLYEEDTETLWIGTGGNGLFRLKNGKFTAYGPGAGIPHYTITYLFRDRMKNIWVGTDGGGLIRLRNGQTGILTNENGLADGFVSSISEDREGSLWVGTLDGGLHRLRDGKFTTYTSQEGLVHDYVNCIYKDRAGDLLIGTKGGLNKISSTNDAVTTVLTTRPGLLSSNVLRLLEDPAGHPWIGTLEGLHRYKDGKLTTFTTRDGLSHNWITCIHRDTRGITWIGTGNGLNRVKLETLTTGPGSFTIFTTREGLCGNLIEFIYEDGQGALWIGTDAGLNRIREGKITAYHPGTRAGGNHFQCVYRDSRGVFWFGTKRGLIRFTLKEEAAAAGTQNQTQTFPYTVQSGLMDNDICSILEDERGYLWLAGPNGISRVRKQELEDFSRGETAKVRPEMYNEKDGMKSRWCTGTACKTRDGRFWFPTSVGVTVIDPNHIKKNPVPPVLMIEKIIVDGESIKIENTLVSRHTSDHLKPNARRAIKSFDQTFTKVWPPAGPPEAARQSMVDATLELAPGKKRLEFFYTALSFINPQKIRFKIKLAGYDKDWVEMGTDRHTTYTGLSPGDYTFKVIACNPDGVWNEKGVSFSFYMKPHWYKTWWAYSFYVLFAIFGVFFFVRRRSTKLTREKKRLEGLVKERTVEIREKNLKLHEQSEKLKEMDRVKSRFFANISHEFRTPLTLIKGPLEEILGENPDKKMEARVNMMLRNSNSLLDLVNQLLDLAKFDSGKMKLHAVRQNIVPFVKSIVMCFESLAIHNEVDLAFQGEADDISPYFDPEKMERIITNLLSNAFNHTPAGGKIRVSIRRLMGTAYPSGCVEILAGDTGIGIPEDRLPHIFDRFYRGEGKNETKQGGTGIGLALVRELVELHHGEIEVHSSTGQDRTRGTEFIIRLPMGNEHLQPEDYEKKEAHELHELSRIKQTLFAEVSRVQKREAGKSDDRGQWTEERRKMTVETSSNEKLLRGCFTDEWGGILEKSPPGKRDKPVILVVEDNADVRTYIRGALESEFNIEEAADGKEGMDRAGEIIPDLVISDIMMPEVDGYELCARLKKDIKTSHIPVILLTAKASETSIARGLETGADDYITKPFNANLLVIRVKNLVRLRRQLQQKIQDEMVLQPGEISVSSIDTEFIKEIKAIIEENLSEPEFNVEQMAKKLYMSQSSLYRKVEALTGQTPKLFIRSYRLKRAAQLLKDNFGNVTEVAFEVGFSSTPYFTKCFKEKFHRLPSDYQASEAG